MIQITERQMASITRNYFFGRVSAFILEQSTQEMFRAVAANTALREDVWLMEWDWLKNEPERLAAMYLCFLLACRALDLDSRRGLLIARGARDPAFSIKTFLSKHGLLRFSAFDVPELTRPASA